MKYTRKIFAYFTSLSSYQKFYHRLLSYFIHLDTTPNPTLIMTLLVKNEEDILEENLIFHKAMGVDGFILTDNNSTDSTPDILKKYTQKGWIKKVILEKGENYNQTEWVNRMVISARDQFGADWVINADADEFWYSSLGNLKKEFCNKKANIVICPMKCVIPDDQKKNWQWNYVVKKPIDTPEKYGLSIYSIFSKQISKVAHRAKGYKQIHPGNHWVDMIPEIVTKKSNIIIYHYTIRSYKHYMNKIIDGGMALDKNPDKSFGNHWRYLYKLYIDGKLSEEYKKIIGSNCLDKLLEDHIIEKDSTIYEIMHKIYNQQES